jgi:hypothetical protein
MNGSLISRALGITMMIAGLALPAAAQGKSKGPEKAKAKGAVVVTSKGEVVSGRKADKAVKKAVKAEQKRDKALEKAARKRVSTSDAVIVTRDVLISNGYQVVNVVPSGTSQVIYYRRGNRGNGRGLGPVEKIIVVPAGDVVRFTSGPQPLLATILRRLGM